MKKGFVDQPLEDAVTVPGSILLDWGKILQKTML